MGSEFKEFMRRFYNEFSQTINPDKEYEFTYPKLAKKRRSLDANAYFWLFLDQLAQTRKEDKNDLYRSFLREVGGVSEIVVIRKDAVQTFVDTWESYGIGYQCEVFENLQHKGAKNVIAYFGTSNEIWDKEKFSTLIDILIRECSLEGINTTELRQVSLYEDNSVSIMPPYVNGFDRYSNGYIKGWHKHHVFMGKNRQVSEKFGFFAWVPFDVHEAIHADRKLQMILMKAGEKAALTKLGWTLELFIDNIGKNYLTDEELKEIERK